MEVFKKKNDKKLNLLILSGAISVAFVVLLIPHIIWLTNNDYVTITYGLHRTGLSEPNFIDHLKYPLIFKRTIHSVLFENIIHIPLVTHFV